MATVRVIARPRIHVGLVDLGHASSRSFCGIGFAVNARPTVWRVEDNTETLLFGTEGLDAEAKQDLVQLAARLTAVCEERSFTATLESVADQHIGLGTKTTMCLSLISAVNALKNLQLDAASMIALSSRGGASGIGVNLFFDGGIIWDGGHPQRGHGPLMPSGGQSPTNRPPKLSRWSFPDSWEVALMLPAGMRANGEYERRFFQGNTPTPKIEALETMAVMYHAIVPAMVTLDTSLLREGLGKLHNVGFKKLEVQNQAKATQAALTHLFQRTKIPVGMSSMGPLLYAIISKADNSAVQILIKACREAKVNFLGVFDGWNSAHEIKAL
jgi:beta-ribofuranosylaminobenzene 5'-phosphate synthase